MIAGAPADLVGIKYADDAGREQTRLMVIFGEQVYQFPEELSRAQVFRAPRWLEKQVIDRFSNFKAKDKSDDHDEEPEVAPGPRKRGKK